MVKQSRSYVVNVGKFSSGEQVEYKVFHVKRDPLVAKKSAIQKANSFSKHYSNKDGYFLFVMVVVEGEEELFLDKDGNEDTKPIDWLDS
ncbi:hypothetical protein [Brevibacillus borstelensis]|uniref:hypothetical protein n=1 Tax=Brevibacillus borstelensis TaxID=45462 RepID=UPI002041B85A|nr:hypothetical protein [Brevibacillus borstelensis]MCM3473691.1 hypothetical protein [Brevibacillus borstelensis]MED1855152.1 hypothetical protein [Brevibacillus borstelensis]